MDLLLFDHQGTTPRKMRPCKLLSFCPHRQPCNNQRVLLNAGHAYSRLDIAVILDRGFCFFNNVGVAVNLTLSRYPLTIQKILIIDWDVQ